jgi:hypothetical protein
MTGSFALPDSVLPHRPPFLFVDAIDALASVRRDDGVCKGMSGSFPGTSRGVRRFLEY